MKKMFLTGCVFILVFGCQMALSREYVSPSGPITRNEHNVSNFTKIEISHGMELIVTPGNIHKLEIETYENLHQYIETELINNTLTIKRTRNVQFRNANVKVFVTVAKLNELQASGGSKITLAQPIVTDYLVMKGSGGGSMQGNIQCNDLRIELSGGGRADISFQCTLLNAGASGGGLLNMSGSAQEAQVHMSGGGRASLNIDCRQLVTGTSGGGIINLSGSTDSYKLSASGGGRVNGLDMTVQTLSANMSGGGHAELTVNREINISASGGGHLNYKGNAVRNHVALSGGASIKKID